MEIITINEHEIEVNEIHPELPLVKFKFVKHWCKIENAFIPNKTMLEYIMSLGKEGFWNYSIDKPASNTTLRQMIDQGIFRINGKIIKQNAMLNFPILSIITFPKSEKLYTTLF